MHVAMFAKLSSVEQIGVRPKMGCSCHAAQGRSNALGMCHACAEIFWLLMLKVRIACLLQVSYERGSSSRRGNSHLALLL